MKESRKEFIRDAHKSACETWKQKIENEFPKLFKSNLLEVGKWYKTPDGSDLICLKEITLNESFKGSISHSHYGFVNENWTDNNVWHNTEWSKSLIEATNKEVEQALIKEAERRGFIQNIDFNELKDSENGGYCQTKGKVGHGFRFTGNKLYTIGWGVWCVFKDGKWAEIVTKTITKEEAEKQLNAKIID